jgi:hypothetical protein
MHLLFAPELASMYYIGISGGALLLIIILILLLR